LRSHLSSLVPQSKLLHSSKKSLESTKTTLSNKILANAEKLSYIGTLRIRSERACKATKIKLSTRASENFTRINVHVERTDQELKMIEVQKLINAYHGKESELSVEIEEMHDKRNIDLTIDDQISRYNILLLKVPRCNVAANIKFQRPLTRNLKDLSVSTKIRAESGLSNMLLLLHETLKNISYSIR
jgi:ribosomal protein S4E